MTERDEAEYVVKEIMKHQRGGKNIVKWLYYIEQMPNHVLEETFMKSNIPYTMVGGQSSTTVKKLKIYLVI